LPWHFNDASIWAHGGLWMTVEFMSRLLIVAILATSTAPRYAQGAQPDVAQLKTVQEKDRKKAEELWQANGSESGPQYLALVESLRNMDLTSKDGQEIVSTCDKLDESCPH
jgi:hypothetical protein